MQFGIAKPPRNTACRVESSARLRDFRSDLDSLGKVLVSAGEKHNPRFAVATIRTLSGPAMVRDEKGLRTGYIFVDVAGRSYGDYIAEAKRQLESRLQLSCGLYARLERAV